MCGILLDSTWDAMEQVVLKSKKLQLLGGHTLLLHNILNAPSVQQNLVSIHVLLEFDLSLNFNGRLLIIYQMNKFYALGFFSNNFFILDVDDFVFQNNIDYSLIASTSNDFIDATIWHAQLGHIRHDRMMH